LSNFGQYKIPELVHTFREVWFVTRSD